MKWILLLSMSTAALVAQQATQPAEKKAPAKAAAKKSVVKKTATAPTQAAPLTLPAGAADKGNGEYQYTDGQGKKWVYRYTPVGLTRFEDGGQAEGKRSSIAVGDGLRAVEDGDVVHFERRTPFGLSKWTKKKSELDEGELAALKSAQASQASAAKQD
jgi:hypothetical protein